jgi:Mannosylglycerate hydrolase MGH1-like glycoside hydrolase domain
VDKSSRAEAIRLDEDAQRVRNWKRWGPYLSERQWGTVREDYSEHGTAWDYFPHDHARSRAYRWGEDGLLGICDRECRLAFALALWNGRDPILKERLFGVSGPEGNHGEDVKEQYFYLDSTPTHSYMKALYKYPQAEYPYARLVDESRRRGLHEPEYELVDAGVFDGDRYFDVGVEYAKGGANDILIRITVANRGPEAARLDLLPTLWFRNTWDWGRFGEGYWRKGKIAKVADGVVETQHPSLEPMRWSAEPCDGRTPELLFTENETNMERLFGVASETPFVKDAFHAFVVDGRRDAVNPNGFGTKAAAHYRLEVPARGEVVVRLRLSSIEEAPDTAFGIDFDRIMGERLDEADDFYAARVPASLSVEERRVVRQGYAGLLWTRQYYHYVVNQWLEGDPAQPPPPPARKEGRNSDWHHLYNRDVISMPDKWEYPWYASWDLAFHMIPFANVDAQFAKDQLVLLTREWYAHPNGQTPAYEWAFGDVNPPVTAWAAWRIYKMTATRGARDRVFLSRVFLKHLLNFTWWVNRKDVEGNNLFSGGFLGLDNIGVFDRSRPLPTGGHLEQADGTAWMAFYCTTMLSMAIELARDNPACEDLASKFFEHFIAIVDAMNSLGGTGLWDEQDGFYYDQLHLDGTNIPLRIRSMVGIIPLFAAENLDADVVANLPGFSKRMRWFIENRQDLARYISYLESPGDHGHGRRLLAIPSRERLERVLKYVLDENEFLSPYGVRSLSRHHADHPFVLHAGGEENRVAYTPGESNTGLFGGNSNWRGPVWFPLNYLLIEALDRYHHFYGDTLKVECPTGSGNLMDLAAVARELGRRMTRLFLPDADGRRPCHGDDARFRDDPHWRDYVLFYEYFHGDTGRGVGASHQTGWTALVVRMIENLARREEQQTTVATPRRLAVTRSRA